MVAKSILITGCSSGIGHAAAVALKERGYRVFATARKMADVKALQDEGFESVALDVNESDSLRQGLQTVLAATGGSLDALFNNAGYVQPGAIEDISRDEIRAQFETNVFGAIELTQLVLPIMRKQGHGRIIQNSSILGIVAVAYCGAYNASKFALEGFSNTLRQELRGTDIYVSIINPGPITTKLRDHAYQHYQDTVKKIASSAYENAYQQMEKTYFNPSKPDIKLSESPDVVVKKLIRALEETHPRAHYFAGRPANFLAIARRFLPDTVLDWVLSQAR